MANGAVYGSVLLLAKNYRLRNRLAAGCRGRVTPCSAVRVESRPVGRNNRRVLRRMQSTAILLTCRTIDALGITFFTVSLLQRDGNDLLIRHIDDLREAVGVVKRRSPFVILDWVVLPEHLHCVIELLPGDVDFAVRWRLIKMGFTKAIPQQK